MKKQAVAVDEIVVFQDPYQSYIMIGNQKLDLPFTNGHCEVRLIKRNGAWAYLERHFVPFDKKDSWMGTLIFWQNELKALGWEGMLVNRLKFEGRITESMAMEGTGCSLNTVRKHFKRLVKAGKARFDGGWGELKLIPPLAE
jgi:hypothetical protein